MNFHQRSLSEQPQSLRQQQSNSPFINNNNSNNNNNATPISDTRGAGEILHSDSQQSLDQLFNPSSMDSITPLRDRNLPASFFNPPWKANRGGDKQENGGGEGGPPKTHINFHSRSMSFDHRNRQPVQTATLIREQQAIPSQLSQARQQHQNQFFANQLPSVLNNETTLATNHISHEPKFHVAHSTYVTQTPVVHQQQQQQNQFSNQQQPIVASRTSVVNNHHNMLQQQPATSYSLEGHFVDNNQYHHHQPLNNNTMTNHMSDEPEFHVAHSTYTAQATAIQQQHQQQQIPNTATNVPSFNTSDQLCTAGDGFSSSGSTMSHSCSNSDFHSGSCSSLHSRSQSCQSSVLDSSMSNLGISGSSSDLPRDSSVTPMFYYSSGAPVVQQQQPTPIPNGASYNRSIQQMPSSSNHNHQQNFQNQLPAELQHTPMEERPYGY